MLLVNLRMDATYIKEGMNISWVSEVRTGQIWSEDNSEIQLAVK